MAKVEVDAAIIIVAAAGAEEDAISVVDAEIRGSHLKAAIVVSE